MEGVGRMTLYCNGIKVCPTITINGGGDIDHGGAYLIKVIDYDGTVLKQDHLNTGDTFELPEPPTTHERLTFQTWSSPLQITNNTITVGKSDVTIGAVYTTKSGKNEYTVDINPVLGLTISITNSNSSEVDWGDGATDTSNTHTYTSYGEYTIKTSLLLNLRTNDYVQGYKEVNLAQSGFVSLNFSNANTFNCLSVSNNATTLMTYSGFAIKDFIVPPSITSQYMAGIPFIQNARSLKNLILPYGFTQFSGKIATYAYTLEKITFPSTVTKVGGITEVVGLKELNFTEHTSVPTLNTSAFFPVDTESPMANFNAKTKIRVPKSLESQWKSATNWSAYADYIVGV